jgi:molecular chaperone DnaJ
MPSALFERDGFVIRSVLRLTNAQAKEGGFFDVETLDGPMTVFVEAGAASGDAKTVPGAGLPTTNQPGAPRGDHVARVFVVEEEGAEEGAQEGAEEGTKRVERSEEDDTQKNVSNGAEAERDEDGDADETRDAKRRKKTSADSAGAADAADAADLAALLAAKKRALLAALEAKTKPVGEPSGGG